MTRARSILPRGCVVAAVLLVGGFGPTTRAEPAFAVRTGYRCSQCHVNRSGGGLRTAFGSIYMQTLLPARQFRWRDERNLLPADPDARFALGADLRTRFVALDVKAGENVSTFEVSKANVYGAVHVLPGRLSLYLDQTVGPGGASSREAFGIFDFGKTGYVKVGKFLPAYGWRLPDDDAFIRQFSGFTYSAPDTGVEVGFEPGRWSLHLAAVNGAAGDVDTDRTKKFTFLGLRRWDHARLGISASNDISAGDTTTHAGLLAGFGFGRLVVLAEGDWVESGPSAATRKRVIGLLEADLLLQRGLNLKLAHDWIDPDRDFDTDERTRTSIGLEWIPYPFVQARILARSKDGPPQVSGSEDNQFELELHFFF